MCTCTKAFHNFRHNAFHLNFPNGNFLSTIFGIGTYSDNHAIPSHSISNPGPLNDPNFLSNFHTFLESNTVEIMFHCKKTLEKQILKKYNEGNPQPIGRVPLDQWTEIINLLTQ